MRFFKSVPAIAVVLPFVLTACGQLPMLNSGKGADTGNDIAEGTRLPVSGDSFTFDNPDMSLKVVTVADGKVAWESSNGETQISMANPVMPALEWNSPTRGRGKRLITDIKGSLFPLAKGNTLTFKTTVNTDKPPYAWEFDWKCRTEGEEQTTVPAGSFDTWRIVCGRNGKDELVFFYAPSIGHYARMIALPREGQDRSIERHLISYSIHGNDLKTATGGSDKPVADMPAASSLVPPPAPIAVSSEPPVKDMKAQEGVAPRNGGEQTPPMTESAETATAGQAPQPEEKQPTDSTAPEAASMAGQKPGFYIHLESYKNQQGVKAGSEIMRNKFPDILSGRQLATSTVEIPDKGTFTRMMFGPFDTKAAAAEACRSVKARGHYCDVMKLP